MIPRMQTIADMIREKLTGKVPFLNVWADDNICSAVTIYLSLDDKSTWINGIYQNSRYSTLMIQSANRYYEIGDKLILELLSGNGKLRKYSSDKPEKITEKLSLFVNSLTVNDKHV